MNPPFAIITIVAIVKNDNAMVYLNVFATFGISMKKLENSTSLAVAPHDMSMLNMWQRSACEMCRDMPPKKTTNIRHHLKFSKTR